MDAALALDYLSYEELADLPGAILPEPLPQSQAPLSIIDVIHSGQRFDGDLERLARATISQTDPSWETETERMLRSSCALFASEVLTGPFEPPYNGRFLVSQHHDAWDDLIRLHRRLCVLAPRDHGKTYFYDFAYPIWKAWANPHKSTFIFSATKDQAVRILADIKLEFETNARLEYLVPPPGSRRRWSSTLIELNNGHKIYARGYGTKIRGAHPVAVIVDDGLNDETVYSDLVRGKQIEYFHTAIANMVSPEGQIIVVGTPFHSADLYADLGENPEYHFARFPALNADGEPLWPERYSAEQLARKKREIGEIRFAREFMVDPVSDDMSLFPIYLFRGDPVEQPTMTLGMPLEVWRELGVTPYMGVDFAISSSVQADYTVIWVMGRDRFGNRWLIDLYREKGLAYQAQLSKINEIGRRYDPALVFLEANQMQRIFGDELIRTTDLPIKQFVTGAAKNTLDKGVPSLRVLLENGKFRIPRGDKRSVELTNTWIEEMRAFTFQDGKLQSVGTHDDTVMACWICDQAIRAGGFSFDFGDDAPLTHEERERLLAELVGQAGDDGDGEQPSDGGEIAADGGNGNGGRDDPPVANLFDPDMMRLAGPGGPILGAPRAQGLIRY